MWYMYTVEYYSAIKQNEILPPAATWVAWRVSCPVRSVSQRKANTVEFHLYAESKQQNKGSGLIHAHKHREENGGP